VVRITVLLLLALQVLLVVDERDEQNGGADPVNAVAMTT
jgi:hypothetical protein